MAASNSWAPWVRLNTPDVLLPYLVTEFELHLEEGVHSWAQLTVRYHLPASFQAVVNNLPPSLWWPDNTPVQVFFGSTSAEVEQFVGYVVSPELMNAPGQQVGYAYGQMLDVRYLLLGATKPLQSATTRTWRACTVPYMAQQIAQENRLAAVIDSDTRVFSGRQQASQSDFAFLQDRAAESGKRLVADGIRLCMTDPRAPLTDAVPRFTQNRTPGRQDTLLAFSAVVGETDPSGSIRAQHSTTGVSKAGVVPPAVSSAPRSDLVTGTDVAPQVQRISTGYVARSYADARAISQAAALRDLWWVHGSARVDGDVRLRPGCVVDLGGAVVTPQHAGEWMTRSAHHRFSLNPLGDRYSTYEVDLELGRDQEASLTRVSSVAREQFSAALVNGRWVAQRGGGM